MGPRLLDAAIRIAGQRRGRRLGLVATNDNGPAIAESRNLKPEIPLTGVNGKRIEDELEFEMLL
ncbi:MAG TPA: hypothetical protein VJK02_19815 [Anaerolineales bacterium]|nr:hypothetical protein [Anaerolineales bacterium]